MTAWRGGVAAALAALAVAASAQPYPTAPAPAPPRPLALAAPLEGRLANGLRVVVARRDGVPLVSAALVALSGSEADPPRLAGLASLMASLQTQGTRTRGAPEIAAAAEALGGSLDSAAGWNQSLVTMTVTTPRLAAALALIAEVAAEPAFAPEEIERVRTQTLDALKVVWSQPGALAGLVAERLAFAGSVYGHPAGGTPNSLPRIGRDDLVALHRQVYRPDNAVLILAGDIAFEAALQLARKHFAGWQPGPGAAAPGPAASAPRAAGDPIAASSAPALSGDPLAVAIDMPRSEQAAVVLGLRLPSRSGGDRAISEVMNAVLGSGYSSRLSQEIRIKRGLSYDAGSGIESRREAGWLRVVVQTKNESAAEVVALIQAEVDRMMATPPGADELAARKATIIGGFSRSVETTAGLVRAIRSLVVAGRPPAELTGWIAALQAVSAADVQRYAAAHLGAPGRRLAVAGEAERFVAPLRAAAPALVVVGADALDLERASGLQRE